MCIDKIKDWLSICWPGLLGALLSLYYTKPLCLRKDIVSFVGGAAAAITIAPAVTGDHSGQMTSAASFLIGTFSMSVFGIAFQVIDKFRASPIHTVSALMNIVIDVLLAFRHGKTRHEKRQGEHHGD